MLFRLMSIGAEPTGAGCTTAETSGGISLVLAVPAQPQPSHPIPSRRCWALKWRGSITQPWYLQKEGQGCPLLPSDLLRELTHSCLQMHKPCSGREEVFDPGALLAPVEEMSAMAGLKEPEDKAVPHHDCSGALSGDTQHLLLFPTHV